MINFNRNNLDKATSPYLQQHKDNPIHWQEWSSEVLAHAQNSKKLLFVSIGYSTCHWCHVMAQEAFSQKEIADYLNQYFVSIKVDREQRPDIDQFMMKFIQETQGQGGWPLNVFLTFEGKPFLALTYVPVVPRYGLPGFLEVLKEIVQNVLIFSEDSEEVPTFHPSPPSEARMEELEHVESEIVESLLNSFTGQGFGHGAQFPPHNTLLFLLYYYDQHKDDQGRKVLETILDVMAERGLHDHLQGGFYRYCVDSSWTIPHFEKMLYDQAMLLWVYSAAYKVLGKQEYKIIAEKIIVCLDQTYADTLYYAAHDADTDHHEGETYLWSIKELQKHLSSEEYRQLNEVYILEENMDGGIHLLKRHLQFLPKIEKKLLSIRQQRAQPFVDKKYITSWNCLLAIAFIVSFRSLGIERLKQKSINIFTTILHAHYNQGVLTHSSYQGKIQSGEFLEDYASLLLLATYLYEENGEYKELISTLDANVRSFKKDSWMENKTADFEEVQAQTFDHPIPSSRSLAEMALFRSSLILGTRFYPLNYQVPLYSDFYHLTVLMSKGNWHIIHTPQMISWSQLPLSSMQIRSSSLQDCYQQKCVEFKTVQELLASFNRK